MRKLYFFSLLSFFLLLVSCENYKLQKAWEKALEEYTFDGFYNFFGKYELESIDAEQKKELLKFLNSDSFSETLFRDTLFLPRLIYLDSLINFKVIGFNPYNPEDFNDLAYGFFKIEDAKSLKIAHEYLTLAIKFSEGDSVSNYATATVVKVGNLPEGFAISGSYYTDFEEGNIIPLSKYLKKNLKLIEDAQQILSGTYSGD